MSKKIGRLFELHTWRYSSTHISRIVYANAPTPTPRRHCAPQCCRRMHVLPRLNGREAPTSLFSRVVGNWAGSDRLSAAAAAAEGQRRVPHSTRVSQSGHCLGDGMRIGIPGETQSRSDCTVPPARATDSDDSDEVLRYLADRRRLGHFRNCPVSSMQFLFHQPHLS